MKPDNINRMAVLVVAVIAAMVLASVSLVGCGADPLSAMVPAGAELPSDDGAVVPATPPEPVAGANPGQPSTLSLHERIMAEQGHDPVEAASRRRAAQAAVAAAGAAGAPLGTSAADPDAVPAALAAGPTDSESQTSLVLSEGQTPLRGVWTGTADRLASYLLGVCPSPRFTVPALELAGYYVRYGAEAHLRADVLWAQMIHETGYGMYGGDVSPDQNNFAGIGATGGGEPGIAFPTAEAGVMAQVAHMVAYVYTASPVAWADAATDPRFDFVAPRGVASVLSDLDGRWAVPGIGYGANVEEIVRAINAG